MTFRLMCVRGALGRVLFELGGEGVPREWTIGRGSTNRVELPDLQASRQHAVLRPVDGAGWQVEDLGSTNGTFVNRQPVQKRRLINGDHLQVGDSFFLYLEGDSEGPDGVVLDPAQGQPAKTLRMEDPASWVRRPDMSPDQSRSHLEGLVQIAEALRGWQSLEGLQRSVLKLVMEWVPAERGAVLAVDPESGQVGQTYGWRRGGGAAEVAVSRSVVQQVCRERSALLGHFDHDTPRPSESVLSAGIRSLIACPMIDGNRAVGVLYLDTTETANPLTEESMRFTAAVAAMAAQPLESARRIEQLEAEKRRLETDLGRGFDMIGDSEPMQKVYQALARAAPTDATVLLLGETGSGKELAARAIHARSRRSQRTFVAINCASIAEGLLESEMFGHERGAFTGAVAQKRGKIELAEGGTLFLDEIGELPPALQAKLLRVLQEREFERVGGTRPIRVDLRLVAATHRDLAAMIAEGHFRSDLYYRLNVVPLRLPPLRERRSDILALATFFLERLAGSASRAVRGFAPDARTALLSYDWPGNVRELQNVVERAVVLGEGEWIERDDLPEEIVETQLASGEAEGWYHTQVLAAKRKFLEGALAQSGGRYVEAARILGIHVKHLHRLMRTYGLKAN